MLRRARYSIHLIDGRGTPIPRATAKSKFDAVDLAEMIARHSGREVRVWNTRESRCIYVIPAAEAVHAA